MAIKDGGPAFPQPNDATRDGQGMSLRDYFAGQALAGVVADWGETAFQPSAMAARAYTLADAMLAEREKAR